MNDFLCHHGIKEFDESTSKSWKHVKVLINTLKSNSWPRVDVKCVYITQSGMLSNFVPEFPSRWQSASTIQILFWSHLMKSHVKVANLLHMIYKILSNEIDWFLFYFLVKEAGSWPLWNNSSSGSHHEPAPPSPPSDGGGPSHEIGTWNSSMIFHHFWNVLWRIFDIRGLSGSIFYPSFRMVGNGLTISSEIITNIFHMWKQELLRWGFIHITASTNVKL